VPSTSSPPIPRQPMGVTFLVAMSLLGLFALLQLAAVAWHYIPLLRAQIIENREQVSGTAVEGTTRDQPGTSPSPATPVAPSSAPDAATIAQAAQLVSEADRNYRIGDFEASLRGLQKAEALLPTDPAIQFRLGQVYEALDDKAGAFVAFEKSVAVAGLPEEVKRQAEQKMALLAQVLSEAADAAPARPGVPFRDTGGQPVRDEIGLQPGSVLGIVDTRLRDSQPGAKTLRIAVKSRPGARVDPASMNVHVFFYEQDEAGEVQVTQAKPATQWISPPVDWRDGEPELLDVEYPLPDGGLPGSSADAGALGRKFYGYVVGVYYNSELQDSRADPGRLDSLFPLGLNLNNRSPEE